MSDAKENSATVTINTLVNANKLNFPQPLDRTILRPFLTDAPPDRMGIKNERVRDHTSHLSSANNG